MAINVRDIDPMATPRLRGFVVDSFEEVVSEVLSKEYVEQRRIHVIGLELFSLQQFITHFLW